MASHGEFAAGLIWGRVARARLQGAHRRPRVRIRFSGLGRRWGLKNSQGVKFVRMPRRATTMNLSTSREWLHTESLQPVREHHYYKRGGKHRLSLIHQRCCGREPHRPHSVARIQYGEPLRSRATGVRGGYPARRTYPLLRSPAAMPLIVR
jgi:hypothetical protein